MKSTIKILSIVVAVSAIISGTTALAAKKPVSKSACERFSTGYATVASGAKLSNGAIIYTATSLVDQIHLLQVKKTITLKDGNVGTLDGFIGLHLPSDGWKYIYNCKSQGDLATITFKVTNPAYTGPRNTQPVVFELAK